MGLLNCIQTDHLPVAAGIYRIVCVPTGECYVGGTADLRKRCYSHAVRLVNGDHHSKSLQMAYREHGVDSFRIEMIDSCDLDELAIRETAWIERLRPAFNTHTCTGTIRRGGRVVPRAVRKCRATRYRNSQPVSVDGAVNLGVERVKAGEKMSAVAKDLGLNTGRLSEACRVAGLELRRGRPKGTTRVSSVFTNQTWQQVDWTKRDTDIARETGFGREYVRRVRAKLGKPKSPFHWQRSAEPLALPA